MWRRNVILQVVRLNCADSVGEDDGQRLEALDVVLAYFSVSTGRGSGGRVGSKSGWGGLVRILCLSRLNMEIPC